MARPRIYANDAERQAAFRARNSVLEFRTDLSTASTLDSIAAELDCSRAELLDSMAKFALLNRNWRQLGLFGKRLPRATPPGAAVEGAEARRPRPTQQALDLGTGF